MNGGNKLYDLFHLETHQLCHLETHKRDILKYIGALNQSMYLAKEIKGN